MTIENNRKFYLPANSVLKKSLIAAIGMLFLMSVYAVYWMLMAWQSEQSLKSWIVERRVKGIEVSVRHLVFKGFPFRLGMDLEGVTIKNVNPSTRTWSWDIPRISSRVAPWRPSHVWFDASGSQNLVIGSNKGQKNYKIKTQRLAGDVVLKGPDHGQLNVNFGGVVFETAGLSLVQVRQSDINLDWHFQLRPNGVLEPFHFEFIINGVELPHDWRAPLGTKIGILRLAGKLTGPHPYGPLVAALKRWRDVGGTIEISRLATEYGPLNLEIEGTFALDKRMQPLAALIARAEGYIETVEALVDADLLQPNAGTAAKLGLSIMARRPEDRPAYVETPLTVQNQILSAGNVNVLHFPAVRWDQLQGLVLSGGGKNVRPSP